jgi:hypothetical protein
MTRSLILSRQALISGQIRDGRTGEAPGTAVAIGLLDRDVPERRHGLVATVTRDARFAFHGDPETALRGIATQTFWLRLEATATGYRTATLNLEIGPAPGQPTRVEIPGLEREDVLEPAPVAALFTGGGLPREGLRLVLDPEPVRLSGRVLSAAAPDQPIGGALVEIVGGGAATSDARGRFAFPDPLPLVATVDVRVTATGFQEHLFDHELAYGEPVNRISVSLRPS